MGMYVCKHYVRSQRMLHLHSCRMPSVGGDVRRLTYLQMLLGICIHMRRHKIHILIRSLTLIQAKTDQENIKFTHTHTT